MIPRCASSQHVGSEGAASFEALLSAQCIFSACFFHHRARLPGLHPGRACPRGRAVSTGAEVRQTVKTSV